MGHIPRDIPHCLKKKALLNNPALETGAAREQARKFMTLGWHEDALEFFLRAGDQEGLAELEKISVAEGDAFLLERILKAQGREAPEVWQQLGEQALAGGKYRFAARAFTKANDEPQAAAALARAGMRPAVPPAGSHDAG